ncbi:MAG: LuxR C-terminal-related transcriptional regulator [Duncaniella sp.]|jgi:DNA-binding CsgD family transcriptional regulator|uniref:LuxR C-terminal-related transcriptional regulator n=1 Tax=Duncaniella muricolitica TaxID=2880704 RepID=UPI0023D3533E|nr:LuxR C-terminal-related transcriptional regulator [Duncaniella muricolitica]MCX4369595.1 LuxR C-terminal-related transcriptional regulator [Duncaniella sp.]MDE5927751.1 LuxR C-terminal-related transcriptional regulator [Duncaniella sp.]
MRVHKVGLLLSSPLLTAGLHDTLLRAHGLNIIDITERTSPESYTQRVSAESPSLMIVDPFTAHYCPVDVPSMLLTTCQVPDNVRDGHVAIASIYDSTESIVSKIRTFVNPSATGGDQRGSDLSPRERDVIMHIVKGLSNKEIAAQMNVSVNTVMTHRRNIASKLEIHSPAGLTIFAIATGMVKIDEVAI